MRKGFFVPLLIAAGSIGVNADIQVDVSSGALTVTSDISGTMIAKVVDPNDKVIIDKRYQGNLFSWVPSGPDGAYRYDVHIVETIIPERGDEEQSDGTGKSEYAGGSVEVSDGQIISEKEEGE